MTQNFCSGNGHSQRLLRTMTCVAVVLSGLCIDQPVTAQVQPQLKTRHYLYDYGMPPGMVGHRKQLARQAMVGYFQPVRLIGPEGAKIDVFSEGSFQAATSDATRAGLMVGHIYRLKITNIPGHPGRELYPSIEIIGRLFPPQGEEVRFAIPVSIPMRDLDPVLNGSLVTRVVYLENPRTAIAEQRGQDDQPFFDVRLSEDPLRVAEKFGRPMVIVRIGSRVPDNAELNSFGFGTPPMRWFDSAPRQHEPGKASENLQGEAAPASRGNSVRQVAWQNPQQNSFPNPARPANGTPATAISRGTPGTTPPWLTADPFLGAQELRLAPWPDEMLLDGGDRNLKSLIADDGTTRELRGLDSEDTVGHFDTLDGRTFVDASNRVAIYAPRFSAVRKIDGLGRTKYSQLVGHVDDELSPTSSRRTDFSSTTLQNIQPGRNRRLLQAVGMDNGIGTVLHGNRTQIKQYDGRFRTYENLRLIKSGMYDSREKGRLAIAIQRANTWGSDVSAQSAYQKLHLIQVDDVRKAAETVHIKTEFNRPQMRLVKVASTQVALPGDEVEFTIRFDNVGDQPIGNITILDNLTGRLDYIEDSSECSLDGTFISEPNKAGSKTLRWEITDPLSVNKGGVIRFRCRVR